jgi:hypothetical protein
VSAFHVLLYMRLYSMCLLRSFFPSPTVHPCAFTACILINLWYHLGFCLNRAGPAPGPSSPRRWQDLKTRAEENLNQLLGIAAPPPLPPHQQQPAQPPGPVHPTARPAAGAASAASPAPPSHQQQAPYPPYPSYPQQQQQPTAARPGGTAAFDTGEGSSEAPDSELLQNGLRRGVVSTQRYRTPPKSPAGERAIVDSIENSLPLPLDPPSVSSGGKGSAPARPVLTDSFAFFGGAGRPGTSGLDGEDGEGEGTASFGRGVGSDGMLRGESRGGGPAAAALASFQSWAELSAQQR